MSAADGGYSPLSYHCGSVWPHDTAIAILGLHRAGVDSYAEGLIEKAEFEPRIGRLRERIAALEEQAQQLAQAEALQEDLRVIIGRLEEFAASVKGGLAEADWSTRRELIRALVKRVEIGQEEVNVVFRVSPDPFVERPDKGVLQHCGGRAQPDSRMSRGVCKRLSPWPTTETVPQTGSPTGCGSSSSCRSVPSTSW
jgi:site-specific DNA recombinase